MYKTYIDLLQSILFLSDLTLAGRKREVYVLAKILKWLTKSKTKSYQIKFVIDSVLHNKPDISEKDVGVTLQEVINYFTIRQQWKKIYEYDRIK